MPDLSFPATPYARLLSTWADRHPRQRSRPPTGDPCSRVYAARISGPISNLNNAEAAIQDELKAMHSDMLETLREFEAMENALVGSFSTVAGG